jgi:hypothetical protein
MFFRIAKGSLRHVRAVPQTPLEDRPGPFAQAEISLSGRIGRIRRAPAAAAKRTRLVSEAEE